MTPLTREEYVWITAYIEASKQRDVSIAYRYADQTLDKFQERFPTPTAEDKPGLNSVKGESIAEQRREFWISTTVNPITDTTIFQATEKDVWTNSIHVTELRPGEVIVTKEMLAKAWDSLDHSYLTTAESLFVFRRLVKGLGLSE